MAVMASKAGCFVVYTRDGGVWVGSGNCQRRQPPNPIHPVTSNTPCHPLPSPSPPHLDVGELQLEVAHAGARPQVLGVVVDRQDAVCVCVCGDDSVDDVMTALM